MNKDNVNSAEDVIVGVERDKMQSYVVEASKTDEKFFRKPIYLMSNEGVAIGSYLNKKQLDRLLQCLGITLTEHTVKDTLYNGKTTVYRTSKEIKLKTIYSPNQVPKEGALFLLRGIISGYVTDIYAQVTDKEVTILKPSPSASHNGFNMSSRKDEPLSDFVKENGYVNVMESSYYQKTRAIIQYKQGKNKMETIINVYNKQNETIGLFRKKEDLQELCNLAGIELTEENQGRDEQGYPFEKFILSRDIKKELVEQPPLNMNGVIQLRGVVMGTLVDVFLTETEDGLVLQEPSPSANMSLFNEEQNPTVVLNFYSMRGSLSIKEVNVNRVGNMARLGDVWLEIIGVKKTNNGTEYKLSSKDYWVNETDITKFSTKEDLDS
ncbi:hypothetical protein ACQUY5_16745 [Bacillus cereus]|uniref:hypothetical protein n=1 Tax=Bacillus cereus TaxID=1396 RepID=UPI003D1777EC